MNRLTHWLPHALLVTTALLTAWLTPLGSPAAPGVVLAAGMTGRTLLPLDEALTLQVTGPPTTLGPRRICTAAHILRSASSR